jgi:hypothetical protein
MEDEKLHAVVTLWDRYKHGQFFIFSKEEVSKLVKKLNLLLEIMELHEKNERRNRMSDLRA